MGTTSTSTISSKGQTVIPAEIRKRHALTEQSRLAWIDDGSIIRVVPLPEGPRKYGRAVLIHKDPEFEPLKGTISLQALPYKPSTKRASR